MGFYFKVRQLAPFLAHPSLPLPSSSRRLLVVDSANFAYTRSFHCRSLTFSPTKPVRSRP